MVLCISYLLGHTMIEKDRQRTGVAQLRTEDTVGILIDENTIVIAIEVGLEKEKNHLVLQGGEVHLAHHLEDTDLDRVTDTIGKL